MLTLFYQSSGTFRVCSILEYVSTCFYEESNSLEIPKNVRSLVRLRFLLNKVSWYDLSIDIKCATKKKKKERSENGELYSHV